MSILPVALKEQRRLGKRICIIIIFVIMAICVATFVALDSGSYFNFRHSDVAPLCLLSILPLVACNNNSLVSIPKSLPSAPLGFNGYRLGIFRAVWLKIWRRYG